MVQLRDFAAQVQPDPGAGVAVVREEPFEDVRQPFRRDAAAAVLHLDGDPVAIARAADGDLSSVGGETEGIG